MNVSNPIKIIEIGGQIPTTVSGSSVANLSGLLTAGIYAVWTTGNNCVVAVTNPQTALSTSFTSTTGYPLYTSQKPEQFQVGQNSQFAVISLSSNCTLGYVKIQ